MRTHQFLGKVNQVLVRLVDQIDPADFRYLRFERGFHHFFQCDLGGRAGSASPFENEPHIMAFLMGPGSLISILFSRAYRAAFPEILSSVGSVRFPIKLAAPGFPVPQNGSASEAFGYHTLPSCDQFSSFPFSNATAATVVNVCSLPVVPSTLTRYL